MWTRASAQAGRAQCSAAVARQTTCELEADALAMDVLNRSEALRVPLDQATSDMQLVQSLAPLWAEEKLRTAAVGLPPPRRATSPERAPPGAESEAVLRARAALRCCSMRAARCAMRDACSRHLRVACCRDAAQAELALEHGGNAGSAAPAQALLPDERGRGSLMACTQAANSVDMFREQRPAHSTSVTTVDGPLPAPGAIHINEEVLDVMTQAREHSAPCKSSCSQQLCSRNTRSMSKKMKLARFCAC